MKIYSYIRMDLDGNVLESISEEYNGQIAECKGNIQVPPPSEEERAIQREILEQMQTSSDLQKQFMPFMLEATGYKYDDQGNIVKMPYEEFLNTLDPVERGQYENLRLIQEKTAQALEGKLPISQQMETNLKEQKQEMEENLARRLGPNWRLSSAGIKSMQEFNTAAEMLRESARRGMVSDYSQLGYAGAGTYGLTPQTSLQQPASLTGYSASLMPTFQSALQPYQFQRSMQFQANAAKQQAKNALWTSLASGASQAAGLYTGYKLFGD